MYMVKFQLVQICVVNGVDVVGTADQQGIVHPDMFVQLCAAESRVPSARNRSTAYQLHILCHLVVS